MLVSEDTSTPPGFGLGSGPLCGAVVFAWLTLLPAGDSVQGHDEASVYLTENVQVPLALEGPVHNRSSSSMSVPTHPAGSISGTAVMSSYTPAVTRAGAAPRTVSSGGAMRATWEPQANDCSVTRPLLCAAHWILLTPWAGLPFTMKTTVRSSLGPVAYMWKRQNVDPGLTGTKVHVRSSSEALCESGNAPSLGRWTWWGLAHDCPLVGLELGIPLGQFPPGHQGPWGQVTPCYGAVLRVGC